MDYRTRVKMRELGVRLNNINNWFDRANFFKIVMEKHLDAVKDIRDIATHWEVVCSKVFDINKRLYEQLDMLDVDRSLQKLKSILNENFDGYYTFAGSIIKAPISGDLGGEYTYMGNNQSASAETYDGKIISYGITANRKGIKSLIDGLKIIKESISGNEDRFFDQDKILSAHYLFRDSREELLRNELFIGESVAAWNDNYERAKEELANIEEQRDLINGISIAEAADIKRSITVEEQAVMMQATLEQNTRDLRRRYTDIILSKYK
jgi:hypothetical protein